MVFVWCLLLIIRAFFFSRANLTVENLALRQQLVVMKRQKPTPRLKCFSGIGSKFSNKCLDGYS